MIRGPQVSEAPKCVRRNYKMLRDHQKGPLRNFDTGTSYASVPKPTDEMFLWDVRTSDLAPAKAYHSFYPLFPLRMSLMSSETLPKSRNKGGRVLRGTGHPNGRSMVHDERPRAAEKVLQRHHQREQVQVRCQQLIPPGPPPFFSFPTDKDRNSFWERNLKRGMSQVTFRRCALIRASRNVFCESRVEIYGTFQLLLEIKKG
ncbi:hypothetical protein TNCV_2628881 [Trichonephila clavipes]|uniref:Uncharacterized protein n=1 Tax=Trichonephila clavipes TaxID=2585209 RepID=A0A8X6VK49_TRICX|nr:hypothetical protein TNCV_2628881 [Trichonephila clavipes]